MATVGVRKGLKYTIKSKPVETEIVFEEVESESVVTPHKDSVNRKKDKDVKQVSSSGTGTANGDGKNDNVKNSKSTEKRHRKTENDDISERWDLPIRLLR